MNAPRPNFTLKDEICAYWSDRAASFDASASHRIEDRYGMAEWRRLLRTALDLGPDEDLIGWRALDIACGTGEISRVLTGLGAQVTAIDFSEPMLAIAAAKLAGCAWWGMIADAEALHPLPSATFDLAVTRHLAWTLTDPAAAYAEWRRVLKPGGRLLAIDGDWSAARGPILRMRRWLANRLDPAGAHPADDRARHEDIRVRVAYASGLTPERLERDLRAAGFKSSCPCAGSTDKACAAWAWRRGCDRPLATGSRWSPLEELAANLQRWGKPGAAPGGSRQNAERAAVPDHASPGGRRRPPRGGARVLP